MYRNVNGKVKDLCKFSREVKLTGEKVKNPPPCGRNKQSRLRINTHTHTNTDNNYNTSNHNINNTK